MKEIIIGIPEHKPGTPDPLWTAWEQTGEIVRCIDCVYKDNPFECHLDSDLEEHGGHRVPEYDSWYCAGGKRKESEYDQTRTSSRDLKHDQ